MSGVPPPGPDHDRLVGLLGKRVRLTLDTGSEPRIVQDGILLGFGDGGDVELEGGDGLVYHAWPRLEVRELNALEEIPVVPVKRKDTIHWVVDCPYCGREHIHSAAPGHRVAHCHRGDGYYLDHPADDDLTDQQP